MGFVPGSLVRVIGSGFAIGRNNCVRVAIILSPTRMSRVDAARGETAASRHAPALSVGASSIVVARVPRQALTAEHAHEIIWMHVLGPARDPIVNSMHASADNSVLMAGGGRGRRAKLGGLRHPVTGVVLI